MEQLLIASTIVICAVAIGYMLAYSFFRRTFFLFSSLAWFVNLVYIALECRSEVQPRTVETDLCRSTTAQLCTALLYFAYKDLSNERDWRKRRYWSILIWLVSVIACDAYVVLTPSLGVDTRHLFLSAPDILFTMYILIGTARRIQRSGGRVLVSLISTNSILDRTRSSSGPSFAEAVMLPSEVRRYLYGAQALFVLAFLGYACLQVFYPLESILTLVDTRRWGIPTRVAKPESLFYLALATKAINGIALGVLAVAGLFFYAEVSRRRSVSEELGVLAASVEHDARNPISTIKTKLKTLAERYQNDTYLLESIQFIRQQVERIRAALEVIPTLRETPEYYNRKLSTQNLVDLAHVSVNAVKSANGQIRPRILIEASSTNIQVRGYRERLVTALVNILNNAVEASIERHDGKYPPVEVYVGRVEREPGSFEAFIRVHDHGTGIPGPVIEHVTEPLFSTKKADNNANRGIGLFIARRIVEMHQGRLDFQSDGSTYTTVYLGLPQKVR